MPRRLPTAGRWRGHVRGQQLRHDHAGVPARPEQRAAGEAGHGGGEIRRRFARQVILRGREGQHEIRTRVAVRDGIDVQLVDLVLVLTQSGETGRTPAAYAVAIQTVQHGFEA